MQPEMAQLSQDLGKASDHDENLPRSWGICCPRRRTALSRQSSAACLAEIPRSWDFSPACDLTLSSRDPGAIIGQDLRRGEPFVFSGIGRDAIRFRFQPCFLADLMDKLCLMAFRVAQRDAPAGDSTVVEAYNLLGVGRGQSLRIARDWDPRRVPSHDLATIQRIHADPRS